METTTKDRQPADIAERILAEIREKRLTMRPRIYFMLKVAALLAVAFAVLVISSFLFGFIFWSIVASGQALLLGFGPGGFGFFFLAFPWGWLFVDVLLIALGKKRIPALYLMIALLAGTVSIGVLLEDITHFNEFLGARASRNELPLLGSIYLQVSHPQPNDGLCRCYVIKVGTSTLLVRDERESQAGTDLETVLFLNASDTSAFSPGERIFVFGQESGGKIRPEGIEKLPPLSASSSAYSY